MEIKSSPSRSSLRRVALLVLGCGLVALAPALRAVDHPTQQPLSDKAPALPVSTTITKATGSEAPPYVLHVKNESKATLKVSAKVLLSVVNHNADKARAIPAHAIEAGQSWSIGELAALDKVVLTAEGFAPAEIVISAKN